MKIQTPNKFERQSVRIKIINVDGFVFSPRGQFEAVGREFTIENLFTVVCQHLDCFTGEILVGTFMIFCQIGRVKGRHHPVILQTMAKAAISLEFCRLVEQCHEPFGGQHHRGGDEGLQKFSMFERLLWRFLTLFGWFGIHIFDRLKYTCNRCIKSKRAWRSVALDPWWERVCLAISSASESIK